MAREQGMIEPFEENQVREGVISYGVSSYGYDIRVADEFKIFTPNPYNTVVDPKHLDERSLMSFKGEMCIVPPNSFALAVTVEYFRIPRGVLTICLGKSAYARDSEVFYGNCQRKRIRWNDTHFPLEGHQGALIQVFGINHR